MVSVNAIFAGFSGVMAGVLIVTEDKCFWIQISMGLSLFSFVLFAWAAEKITDALDEGKVSFYMCSMLIYNIAVVLLFFSVGISLLIRGYYFLCVIPLGGSIYPWIKDICWLLFARKSRDYKNYIEEICKES
jgi:hypothetical protein